MDFRAENIHAIEDKGDKVIVNAMITFKNDDGEFETKEQRQTIAIEDVASIYKDRYNVRVFLKNGKSIVVDHSLEEMERYFIGNLHPIERR